MGQSWKDGRLKYFLSARTFLFSEAAEVERGAEEEAEGDLYLEVALVAEGGVGLCHVGVAGVGSRRNRTTKSIMFSC